MSLLLAATFLIVADSAVGVVSSAVVVEASDPAMFTVGSDGRIWFSERSTGRIGTFDPAAGSSTTYVTVPDLCTGADKGLYGLALHPAYPQPASVYAYATRTAPDGSCRNEVLRFDPGAGGPALTVLLDDPYTGAHIGGRIRFGPDGNLYVATGDGASGVATPEEAQAKKAQAQDVGSRKGKVLRMTPEGGVPAGNPFANHTFAYGFRNVFGLDFDPSTGRLWVTDNGPDPDFAGDPRGPGPNGGCNDELNLVAAGRNYGWGAAGTCATPPANPFNSNQDGPDPVLPAFHIEAASGITGAVFCSGCGLGSEFDGRLLFVDYDYRTGMGEIRAATLTADRTGVASDALVHRVAGGPPLSLERGPDGAIYYSDSGNIRRLGSTTTTTTTTTAPTATTALVTSVTPTRQRQDFSGWVGMRLVVGSTDLRVTALGRWVLAGNSGSHTVKLVDAATGADVGGGSVEVVTAGAQSGRFAYADLAQPVTLRAGGAYYLVSLESAGGDAWYDYDTTVATTAAAADTGYVWAHPNGGWNPGGSAGQALGPLSLLYGAGTPATVTTTAPTTTTTTTAPGTTAALVTSVTPTRPRQDFSGWVGMRLVVGSTDLRVTALGRWVLAGNSGSHTLKLVDGATGADVGGGSVQLATAGAQSGRFGYADLAQPVTLRAGASYYLVSLEAAGGDAWYDYDTTVATTAAAADTGYVWAHPNGGWNPGGSTGQALGPLSLLYGAGTPVVTTTVPSTTTTTTTASATTAALVTSTAPTRQRNDFSGWVGMRLVVGPTDLRVTALGRWVLAGNSGSHTLKLVDAGTGADVGGGSVELATAGAQSGRFGYANLAQPVTLRAGATYYLVSLEGAGGDTWYDYDTTVATTAAASDTGYVWAFPGGAWNAGGSTGQALGPLSLLYATG